MARACVSVAVKVARPPGGGRKKRVISLICSWSLDVGGLA